MFDHKKHARLASPQMDGHFQAGQAVVSAFSIITIVIIATSRTSRRAFGGRGKHGPTSIDWLQHMMMRA